ncbi:MAG: DUF362 domain-containing protein [Endomicrobiia bacterium]
MNDVYFIKNLSQENFEKLLKVLDLNFIEEKNFVALKTHFGEENSSTFISPYIYKPLIRILNKKKSLPFFTDTNTIYTGKRANAIEHLKLAHQHGFNISSLEAPIIIADGIKGNDFVEVEINLKHFKTAKIASNIYNADAIICLTHFKGHMLFGFAGTIKNLGMGCAVRSAKYLLHNVLKPKIKLDKCKFCGKCIIFCPVNAIILEKEKKVIKINTEICVGCGECIHICSNKVFSIPWDLSYKEVQEKTVEYAYAAIKNKKDKCLFINFLMNITKDCDCIPKKQIPAVENIGIVAGCDPVAVDFCSLNIVNEYLNKDIFKEFWPNIDYSVQINYAEKIFLGKKEYNLIEVKK